MGGKLNDSVGHGQNCNCIADAGYKSCVLCCRLTMHGYSQTIPGSDLKFSKTEINVNCWAQNLSPAHVSESGDPYETSLSTDRGLSWSMVKEVHKYSYYYFLLFNSSCFVIAHYCPRDSEVDLHSEGGGEVKRGHTYMQLYTANNQHVYVN